MIKASALALGILLHPLLALALAHHSAFEYDRDTVLEFTGVVVRLQWQNPHVRFHIRVQNNDGSEQIWKTEAMDVNSLDRAGVARDLVEVGQVVTVAGSPSSRRDNALLATNLLLPDGREVLTLLSATPRWTDDAIGGSCEVVRTSTRRRWPTSFVPGQPCNRTHRLLPRTRH